MLNVSKTGSLQRIPIFASALLMRTRLYKTMENNKKRKTFWYWRFWRFTLSYDREDRTRFTRLISFDRFAINHGRNSIYWLFVRCGKKRLSISYDSKWKWI